jgi:hypothetical protein
LISSPKYLVNTSYYSSLRSVLHSRYLVPLSLHVTLNACAMFHTHRRGKISSVYIFGQQTGRQKILHQMIGSIPWLQPALGGFDGLEVARWPLVLKFAGSNPAEAVGFFRAKKSSARLPRRGIKSRPVPCRRFAACTRTLKIALIRSFQAKFTGHF